MTQFTGRVKELHDDHPYAMWDAAYVLGSLSSNERREYEAHLKTCAKCRAAVAELSGMPALLAMLDKAEVAALEDDQPEPPPLRPEVLDSLLAKVSWRRRRSRWMTATVVAAAAALATALVFAIWPVIRGQQGESQATGPTLTMTEVSPTPISATVTLTSYAWGTRIDMACSYGDWSNRGPDTTPENLAMVVVGRDGSQTEIATWMGLAGATALPSANTPMPMDQIDAVQLVSSDTRKVLLQTDL